MIQKQDLLRNWFLRTAGDWNSERRYLYLKDGQKVKNDLVSTSFSITSDKFEDSEDIQVIIAWESSTEGGEDSGGEMNCTLSGNLLLRNIGYFTEEETSSEVDAIDYNTIVMTTSYNGCTFREEIRLLAYDTIRLRQTLGFKDGSDVPFLCGQYFEIRKTNQ